MLLAHLSDPHLIDWSGTSWRRFANKRLSGAANFSLRRAKMHRREVLDVVLDDIACSRPDHVVITGDITSLGFRRELQLMAMMLDRHGLDGARVSVIPGNHDAYTPASWRKRVLLSELGAYATCDLHRGMPGYPFVRLRGPLSVIGLNSAVPRPWFVASGLLGSAQLRFLSALLHHPEVRTRFPVILIHHPPTPYPTLTREVQAGLIDRHRFLKVLAEGLDGRPALVLSGHWHHRLQLRLDLGAPVELMVAPSASHFGGVPERWAGSSFITFGSSAAGVMIEQVESRFLDPSVGLLSAKVEGVRSGSGRR